MRKLLFVIGAFVVISAVSYYGYYRYRQAQVNQSQANTTTDKYTEYDKNIAEMKWLQRYPQLKNVASGSMTATIDKLRTSESISELIGPIDNAYGVRNDILDKILSIVPESNPQMLRAAIMSAYYDNLVFYSDSSELQLLFASKFSLANNCLSFADFNKDKNLKVYNQVSSYTSNAMRNTEKRLNHLQQIEQTTLAWQVLGSNLASNEEDELCQKGNY